MSLTSYFSVVSNAVNDLFFPPICTSCGNHLFKHEVEICGMCIRRLPRTYAEKRPTDNMISALMWGRCRVLNSYALFHYKKGERVQKLLHEIKYRGNKPLGYELGRHLGKVIAKASPKVYDYIIPIPLHPKKERKRGFNQAEIIAVGIGEAMDIEVLTHCVYRNTHTSTQTKKGRFERWENVQAIFSLQDADLLENKHILLIDDVITTGATMEACIHQLATIKNIDVSVAAIACAAL